LSLALNQAVVNGPGTLTVAPGRTLTQVNGAINAPLVVHGTLVVDGAGSPAVGGALAVSSTGTLRVTSTGQCCQTTMVVANGFTNAGLIELTSAANLPVILDVTNGTLANAATGTVRVLPGAGGARTLRAQLDNQGVVDVQAALVMDRASSAHANSGTLQLIGGDLTLSQSGTSPSLTTTGQVVIGAGRTLTVSGGAFDYDGGAVGGLGTLALTNATASFTPDVVHDTLSLALNAAVVNGPGTLTVAAGRTLTQLNGAINAALVIDGTLVVDGAASPALNGALTVATSGVLRVTSTGQCCQTNLFVANGFANNGQIELTSATNLPVNLTVINGTLVNAVSATIRSLVGGGGSRGLTAQLDNQGFLVVEAPL
jgi:hypothetical protein